MNQKDLSKQILKKQRLIHKHQQELYELKSQCLHKDFEQKEEYCSCGYDYVSETYYYKVCNTCGKRFDEKVKYGDHFG